MKRTLLAGALLLGLALSAPAFAQFTGGGTAATNWLVQLLTPFAALAIVVFAAACTRMRIPWGWLFCIVVAVVMFFGRDQVLSMIRGWFGT